MVMRTAVGIVVVACLLLPALTAEAGKKWTVYENCRLVEHPGNDGDSFHVMANRKHYIFRLYFVDAPETDDSLKERLQEQADYWETDAATALRIGKEATEFTRDFLKYRFTVYTKRRDAKGRSSRPRYFAMVQVGDKYLSHALVRNGLARVYGKRDKLPDGASSRKHAANLKAAERMAKRDKLGVWAGKL